jgi:hypothetical protein
LAFLQQPLQFYQLTGLPGGRRHGQFPQMLQFLKAEWPRKFVAVKVAVKGFKMQSSCNVAV